MYNHIRLKHEGVAPKGTIHLKLGRPETKHQNRKRRVCGCGKTFKYRQGLHRHIKDKHKVDENKIKRGNEILLGFREHRN